MRDDIIARLRLRKPEIHVSGLDRRNLFLEVAHCPDEDYRWRRLTALLDEAQRPGIIYVATRRAAEELAERLTKAGYSADFYHGGMAGGVREQRHEDFTDDKVDIMVATSAFGMGIDKAEHPLGRARRPARLAGQLLAGDRPGRPRRRARPGRCCSGGPRTRRSSGSSAAARPTWWSCASWPRRCAPARDQDRAEGDDRPRARASSASCSGLLEQVGAAIPAPATRSPCRCFAPLPAAAAEAAVAEHERQQVVQRSRTDMMRALRRDPGLPHADPAGVLRRGAEPSRAGTATTASTAPRRSRSAEVG